VLPASQLFISGKTNVNSFVCSIDKYCGRDTLELQEGGPNSRPVFLKGHVGLDASSFSCGMQMMTNDFGKTIKSKQYPQITIDFRSFERVPRYDCDEEILKGVLAISLAGMTRTFEMDCTLEAKPSGHFHLKGQRDFQFSDFKLEAPTRMMGMIKVQETLNVRFHLVLQLDTRYW